MSDPVDTPSLDAFEATIGYSFDDRRLLERALTHPSYCQGRPGGPQHNQRLEFLGDAVLGLILAEQLYDSLPREREGILTRNRSALAKGTHLSDLARELGLAPYLRLSEAEERNRGRDRESALEDALEAVIGAIYLDSDIDRTRAVVRGWMGDLESKLKDLLDSHNPKGRLQEIVQPLHGNDAIVYEVLEESGPDHAKNFTVSVEVQGVASGQGTGNSKKEAEENAARAALQSLDEAE